MLGGAGTLMGVPGGSIHISCFVTSATMRTDGHEGRPQGSLRTGACRAADLSYSCVHLTHILQHHVILVPLPFQVMPPRVAPRPVLLLRLDRCAARGPGGARAPTSSTCRAGAWWR